MTQQRWFKIARALVLAFVPVATARLTDACPALFTSAGLFAIAGGIAAGYLATRKSSGTYATAGHFSVWSCLGVIWYQFQEQLAKLCGADFLHQVPTILATAAAVTIAAYVHGPSESK